VPTIKVSDTPDRIGFPLNFLQVAFKRFVDYIPMIIDFELFKGFERTLDDALFKGMALGEDQNRQRCAAFLKEDPAIIRRRESLHQDLERFEAALADLQNISALDSSSGYSTDGEVSEAPDETEGDIQIPISTSIKEAPPARSSVSSQHPSPARSHISAIEVMPQEAAISNSAYDAPLDEDPPVQAGPSPTNVVSTGGKKKKKKKPSSSRLLGESA